MITIKEKSTVEINWKNRSTELLSDEEKSKIKRVELDFFPSRLKGVNFFEFAGGYFWVTNKSPDGKKTDFYFVYSVFSQLLIVVRETKELAIEQIEKNYIKYITDDI